MATPSGTPGGRGQQDKGKGRVPRAPIPGLADQQRGPTITTVEAVAIPCGSHSYDVASYKQMIRDLPPRMQYEYLLDAQDSIILQVERYGLAAQQLLTFIQTSVPLHTMFGREHLQSVFTPLTGLKELTETTRKNIAGSIKTITSNWGEGVMTVISKASTSKAFLESVRSASNAHKNLNDDDGQRFINRVNQSLLSRLQSPKTGTHGQTRHLMAVDFGRALPKALNPGKSDPWDGQKMPPGVYDAVPVTNDQLEPYGMMIHPQYFFAVPEEYFERSLRPSVIRKIQTIQPGVGEASTSQGPALIPRTPGPKSPKGMVETSPSAAQSGSASPMEISPRFQAPSAGTQSRRTSPLSSIDSEALALMVPTPREHFPRSMILRPRRPIPNDLAAAVGGRSIQRDYFGDAGNDIDSDFEEDIGGIRLQHEKEVKKNGKCSCTSTVPATFKTKVAMKSKIPAEEEFRLLAIWYEYAGAVATYGEDRCGVCFFHTRCMATRMGLQTRALTHTEGIRRLRYVYIHRGEIGTLKTGRQWTWWKQEHRPARPSDQLGVFKYASSEAPIATDRTTQELRNQIYDILFGRELRDQWTRDGTVIIPGVFSWLWDPQYGIASMIDQEFELYMYHTRRIGGKSNLGWCRAMFYSLVQQVIRQDPLYWLAYIASRDDGAYRMISWPYYTKFTRPGDNTFFRHIDISIPEVLANANGKYQIQGSVSLDNETDSNCTVMLPKFHTFMGAWYKDRTGGARGKDHPVTNGRIHAFRAWDWTAEDEQKYNTSWKATPCPRGGIRISDPRLPHGSTGNASSIRRTILPWFVAIQDDHESLEIVEGGTYTELAEAHKRMEGTTRTPSGHPFRYGKLPFRFPASVELDPSSPISAALVGQKRWDSPYVANLTKWMLDPERTTDDFRDWMERYRERTAEKYREAFLMVKELETRHFQNRSFFYKRSHRIPFSLDEDVDQDPEPKGETPMDKVDEQQMREADVAHNAEGIRPGVDLGLSTDDHLTTATLPISDIRLNTGASRTREYRTPSPPGHRSIDKVMRSASPRTPPVLGAGLGSASPTPDPRTRDRGLSDLTRR